MKNILKFAGIAILTGTLFFQSCQKTDDTTDSRDKFVGSWAVQEGPPDSLSYAIGISKTGSSAISIDNFALLGSVVANVSGSTFSLTPNQVIKKDTISSGTGTLSGSRLSISYTLKNRTITAVCTKK